MQAIKGKDLKAIVAELNDEADVLKAAFLLLERFENFPGCSFKAGMS